MIVAEINGATAMEEAAHPFIHHLESCFGRIAEGWHLLQRAVDGNVLKIDAVLCSGGLIPDVAVVSTVGLIFNCVLRRATKASGRSCS
jgi:hypothetical protein